MAKKLTKADIAKLKTTIDILEKEKMALTKAVMLTAAERAAITPEEKASREYGFYWTKTVPMTDEDRAIWQRAIDFLKSQLPGGAEHS